MNVQKVLNAGFTQLFKNILDKCYVTFYEQLDQYKASHKYEYTVELLFLVMIRVF